MPDAAERGVARRGSSPALTIVDVALRYGAGFDGLATYLRAKLGYAERTRAFQHHVIVPAPVAHRDGGWSELRQSTRSRHDERGFARRGGGELLDLLAATAPDVVLLHGPFARAGRIVAHVHVLGARAVGVPWRGQVAAAQRRSAVGRLPPGAFARPAPVDGVLGAGGTVPRRLGVDDVFRPLPDVRRGTHVLFAGELSRSGGVFDLLTATAYSGEPREVQIYGRGKHERALRRHIASFGLSHRVHVNPYLTDRAALAKEMACAGCIVVPGPPRRGELVALEAAATGVPIVACGGSAITRLAPELAHPFPQGDISALAAAIRGARAAPADPVAGARLRSMLTWENAFRGELDDIRELFDLRPGRG